MLLYNVILYLYYIYSYIFLKVYFGQYFFIKRYSNFGTAYVNFWTHSLVFVLFRFWFIASVGVVGQLHQIKSRRVQNQCQVDASYVHTTICHIYTYIL